MGLIVLTCNMHLLKGVEWGWVAWCCSVLVPDLISWVRLGLILWSLHFLWVLQLHPSVQSVSPSFLFVSPFPLSSLSLLSSVSFLCLFCFSSLFFFSSFFSLSSSAFFCPFFFSSLFSHFLWSFIPSFCQFCWESLNEFTSQTSFLL